MALYDRRDSPRPEEYLACKEYTKAFQHTFWTVDVVPFGSDRHDYENKLTYQEKELVKRCSLAISTIEVKVKSFWAKAGLFIPKPEVSSTCFTFANSEVIHEEAYSKIFEEIGIDILQEEIEKIPAIAGRLKYLKKHLGTPYTKKKLSFAYSLAIFAATIEGISLFSQFYIIKAIQRRKNCLNAFGVVTDYTANEEILHSNFGAWLFTTLVKEYPEMYDKDFLNHVRNGLKQCLSYEYDIVDWIFEESQPDFISREEVKQFINHRYNSVCKSLGFPDLAIENEGDLDSDWFYEHIGNKQGDFLNKRPTEYSTNSQKVKIDDLF